MFKLFEPPFSAISENDISDVLKTAAISVNHSCPRCHNNIILKNGRTKLGRQRYICRSCGKSFSQTTGTAFMYSKKPLETWVKYVDCLNKNLTIRETASLLNISIATSFFWRHKILSVITSLYKPNKLSKNIEINELRLTENFKGNRSVKPEIINNRRNYVMVLSCMDTDNNRLLRTSVMNRIGRLDRNALDQFLAPSIDNGKIIIVPRNDKYVNFAKFHNMKICMVGSYSYRIAGLNAKRADEQSVKFKKFLHQFAGVASKYLSYYIHWFILNINRSKIKLHELFSSLTLGKRQLRVYEFCKVQFDGSLVHI